MQEHTVLHQNKTDSRSIDEVLADPAAQAQAEQWNLPNMHKNRESPLKQIDDGKAP
jgi:hypothetical protein